MNACLCGNPPEQLHHVVYQQHVRNHGGDTTDPRNLVPLCYDCHRRHHNRTQTIALADVPQEAVDYAHELLGDYAGDYLNRYYGGGTP